MDEQLKALLEDINALKSGQEETKERMENMQRSQEETKERMEEEIKNELKERMANKKCRKEELKSKLERIEEVAGNFTQRVEDLEKKLLACRNTKNESKFVSVSSVPMPASPMPLTASPVSVKLSTYDRKTNWEQHPLEEKLLKYCTLPDIERLNLNSLYNALDFRFGQKYSKDYICLQMKTGLQKTGESSQEYASEIERLANLVFYDHPATVRETISLQYFVDGLKEGEIQKAVRMADVPDIKSALKLEAATQASRRDRQSIRGARVTLDAPCESPWKSEIWKLRDEFQSLMAQHQNQEKRNFKCWGCVGTGHLRRNCPLSRKDENTVSSSKQEN
ncbi:uncharacterized protein TNCV_580791 [Trichonephila clavipes]|nr:uncharacterized protein TNCV_580791 [Trichonephila clavipes]